MAFLKFATSIVLGGGIGYSLLQIVSPNESEIIKYLPPYSSQEQKFFKLYKQQSGEFINQDKLNINSKKYKLQDSTNVLEK